ncbi:2-dehydropantoate 2-reductase [Microbacteriaceae bacterium SG_E_30_P1]|uniref:2-dehydropantoate 2-reductase n=1 Tax=Antiquaquibacter oligotrophicus TaxID=2880260 RepID=A0ABT6KKU5_9MICO|nr:2-dehydropantoate 2-reductase [Antiquaquibacter oligotrophicus]MDH6180605.1 2-dehydropantoate 2-reductase [Antiquaquibacter oligotrophicus]UDF13662.1 2-dehydropantoate 2-reductase [Antiquaquibacter oligotrophicus]
MRVGVIGAGAVGGSLAALLARGGHDVEVTARGAHLEAIRAAGIRLTGAWGDYTAVVEANSVLTRAPELVIVATKAQDSVAAIRENIALLRGVPVLVVQNGLDAIDAATAASPRSDVVGGLAAYATSYLSPGVVTVTTAGNLYVGVAGEDDVPARYVASVLNPVIPTTVVQNFVGAQWTKLIINQVNALPAITGLSVQEVVADARLRRIMTASMREAVRTGLRRKVRFVSLQGLGHRSLRLFAALPLAIGGALPSLMSARIGKVPNPGSTLQSIRRGQATEIDYLNGAVVREAELVGSTAPVNALLVTLVHDVEDSGDFLTADHVWSRFRAL